MGTNLTFINSVKDWVGNTTPDDDKMLNRLISSASTTIMQYLQRPNFARTVYNEKLSGRGSVSVMMRNWPVISVSAVSVNATNVPAAADCNQYGYLLETWDGTSAGKPQLLMLNGCVGGGPVNGYNGWNQPYQGTGIQAGFNQGLNNISITYSAGYCITSEAATIPSSPYILNPAVPNGPWLQDDGVTYADGTALVKVSVAPSVGQYQVSQDPYSGVAYYTFNSGDAGSGVLLNYSYIPYDVEQACIEMVSERYKYRNRIGQSTSSLGGQQTAGFSLKAMQDYVKLSLQPYRKVFPI